MKPNFALILSFEGISLLQRSFPGWTKLREIGFDGADLNADLAQLRDTAQAADPGPIRTKLVIPNDQIRYLSFDAAGLEGDEIAAAVHRALDGATPYAVDDLVYDWSISAGEVHVAAVARETLSEAESFAAQHGFNPLCFVAIPEDRTFLGEPWFGETSMAPDLLDGDERVIRDTAAIRIIATAPAQDAPASDPNPAKQNTPEAPQEEQPQAEQPLAEKPQPQDAPQNSSSEASKPTQPAVDKPIAQPKADAPAKDQGPAAQPDAPEPAPPQSKPTPDAAPKADAEPVTFSTIRATRDAPSASAPAPRIGGTARDADPAKTPDGPASKAPARAEPPITATPPPAPDTTKAAKVTGTPENAASQDAAARMGATLRPTDPDRLARTPVVQIDASDPADLPLPDDPNDPGDIPPPPAFMAETAASAPADPDADQTNPGLDPAPQSQPGATALSTAARGLSFVTRRARDAARRSPKPTPKNRAANTPADHEREKQRMTVFGARKQVQVGGKPRFLGVILTAVLLIFLVGVAAWASIFMEDGLARMLRDPPADQITTTASTPEPPKDSLPAEDPVADAAESGGTVVAALPGVTTDVQETPRQARPEPAPAILSETEARTRYAVTGIWQRAPDAPTTPSITSTDDFYLTSIDPKVIEQDAVALPDTAPLLQDTRPDTPPDPPAPGTTFRIDPRGFVQATPQGALTPEGVVVFAGQPAVTPPDRPAETLQPSAEDTQAAEAAARATQAETSRLAAIRPRPRPNGLAESNERETLGGRTRSELAAIRPKLRPPSAQQLAEQAAAADAAVDAAVAEAQSTPDPFAGATKQAVSTSIKPNPRPGNFDRIVKRAEREAQQETVRTAAVAVPRNQRIKPSGPTPTTVARAATEKNALRLKRVNLIGVYGSSSNRRALVRLANGRYKKVKVGDRLDGGRVSAIGTSDLRYVKSGRSVILKMPKG